MPTLVCEVPVDVISVPHEQNHVPRRSLIARSPQTHERREAQQPHDEQAGGDRLLHISGLSGEGVSTVKVFIVVTLLLSLGGEALWFLWKYIRDSNVGSDDERDLRKTRRYEQKFSSLVEKQNRELQRIAELEDRFELQVKCLQMDKARILQMLRGQQSTVPTHHPDEAVSRHRRVRAVSYTHLTLPTTPYV